VVTAKPAVAAGPAAAKAAPATQATPTTKAAVPAKHDPFAKTIAPKTSPKPAPPTAAVAKKQDAKKPDAKPDTKTAAAKPAEPASSEAPAESNEEAADKKKESGFITAGSRRDPFVSPIVQHMTGTGCSTGKRCLAIDQIALRGIVKSDGGMIAVVVNSLDKAYFLRENDPVFNGYVLKISGDSVVFKETVQDKLGHLSTREVVKKITTPAV
jgi:Tfp pilus assembly protein PilP